jgi:hypothetical protein
MKHEFVHKDRLSIDNDKDAKAVKLVFELLCVKLKTSCKITGYLRELHSDPFGFILLSELQVKIGTIIKKD